MMLMAILERRSEIGLRRALGATNEVGAEIEGPRPWYRRWWVVGGGAALLVGATTAAILFIRSRGEKQCYDARFGANGRVEENYCE